MRFDTILVFVLFINKRTYGNVNDNMIVSTEVDKMSQFGNDRIENPYNFKIDLTSKDKIILKNRRFNSYPFVEVGPGSFKAEHKKLPPDYLVNQFKKLLAIKKKMEENNDSK
ncbi:unnamed protein product [Euphydryas editha]|uniref:Uncharacterized protein n=1 Tax=Euphydryas editha TaxID=104508 RepID=A0AAU9U4L0_EUPED|nr:unnamed protein product [Euphydryas editha]